MTKKGYKQTSEAIANNRASVLKYNQEHSGKNKKIHNTPEARANQNAAQLKAKNTPEVFELIKQYGSPLVNRLRTKYRDLNGRCNNPKSPEYKWYGGRGIQNLFQSQLDFLNYVIKNLGITEFSQIDGLDIDRIDNNSHYMPENIRFVAHRENLNNRS